MSRDAFWSQRWMDGCHVACFQLVMCDVCVTAHLHVCCLLHFFVLFSFFSFLLFCFLLFSFLFLCGRFLGRVRSLLSHRDDSNRVIRQLLLTEMIARVW